MTEPLPIDAPSGEGDRAGLLGAALLLFSFARPCYSQVDCVVVGTSSAPRCDVVKGGGRLSDAIASFLSAPIQVVVEIMLIGHDQAGGRRFPTLVGASPGEGAAPDRNRAALLCLFF